MAQNPLFWNSYVCSLINIQERILFGCIKKMEELLIRMIISLVRKMLLMRIELYLLFNHQHLEFGLVQVVLGV